MMTMKVLLLLLFFASSLKKYIAITAQKVTKLLKNVLVKF